MPTHTYLVVIFGGNELPEYHRFDTATEAWEFAEEEAEEIREGEDMIDVIEIKSDRRNPTRLHKTS